MATRLDASIILAFDCLSFATSLPVAIFAMRLPSITIAAFLMSSVFDAVKILSTITTVETFVPLKN